MKTYRAGLFISLFAGIALASACGSDASDVAGGASGAGAGGGTSHAGNAGTGAHAGSISSEAGAAGEAGSGASGGAAGSAAAGEGGASGDTGSAGDAGSAGDGGSAGETGNPVSEHHLAYVATFLNGLIPVSIDPTTGKLTKLSTTSINPGTQLYAVSVDPTQHFVYTAEQGTKKINTYAIAADGNLPAQPTSSTTIAGRPTSLVLDGGGRFAYVASSDEDKGIYPFAIHPTTGALTSIGDPLQLPTASPAYVAVDPSGNFLYASQNAAFGLRGYRINQTTGALTELAGSPWGNTQVISGAIAFHPSGHFLYTSGSGLNAFAVNSQTGALTLIDGSPFTTLLSSDPSASNIAVDPSGRFLYAASFLNPSRVYSFAIDVNNGKLSAFGTPVQGGSPYSLGIDRTGHFVLVGHDDGTTAVFSIQSATGALTAVEGSPFQIGGLQPEFAFAITH